MRLAIGLMLSLTVIGAPIGAECSITNARYIQPDAPWSLTFERVPKYGAANQIAAFALELPNSGVTLHGAVHGSNGFGSPLWSIEGPCSSKAQDSCQFLMENQSPPIYGIYDGVVKFLEAERGSVAPEQIILPQLAVSLWDSNYRDSEWAGDDVMPGDAFLLEGCE
ncbi:hypothetical protein [Devosia rhizoryzae]|uniref:Uncharacterized protein n=1 Tax=Devosia rhizoryzae TaxID=2774137 RepID=A0ABX7CB00_9HYPH|nr:hypothetical protein [Devosia rhizoryzae]QQR39775.1 hypothetical protein JI748_01790 [Devosia rhizoryzae]